MRKLLLSLLLLLPLTAMAQQKIAVVNSQQIMTEMKEFKAAQKKIEELTKTYTADLKGMETELQKKTEAFIKEEKTMLDAIKKRRQQELQDIQQRIQQSYQAMQGQLQEEQQKLLQPIQQKLLKEIKRVADAEKCTYVMEAGVMLHLGQDAINLTDKVKKGLGIK